MFSATSHNVVPGLEKANVSQSEYMSRLSKSRMVKPFQPHITAQLQRYFDHFSKSADDGNSFWYFAHATTGFFVAKLYGNYGYPVY